MFTILPHMQMACCRQLGLVLLLLVFSAQSLASIDSLCLHQKSSTSVDGLILDSAMADHAHHALLMSSADSLADTQCCNDCACVLGSCASAIVSAGMFFLSPKAALLSSPYNELAEGELIVSRYRPPISS